MELKKAIEVLNKLEFEDYEYTYNGLYHNIDTILIKQAFDTVLEELNNRIPRKKVEELLEEIRKEYFDLINNKEKSLITKNIITHQYNAMETVLEELLNKE